MMSDKVSSLWAGAGDSESDWARSLRTPATDDPGESQEAAQSPWNVLQEALLSSGSFPESRPTEPHAAIQSVVTPGSHELTENEIGALFGSNRSLIALHWNPDTWNPDTHKFVTILGNPGKP